MPNVPMSSIPYLRRAEERAAAAAAAATTTPTPIVAGYTAADAATLRGIPAVGRGVHGHIAGSQPERHVCR
jgi:hypothetical protein